MRILVFSLAELIILFNKFEQVILHKIKVSSFLRFFCTDSELSFRFTPAGLFETFEYVKCQNFKILLKFYKFCSIIYKFEV